MQLDFLKYRSFTSENMDNFSLQGEELKTTISGLSTINKYLGNSNAILKELKPLILDSKMPLKIIDLGCGGADIIREIATYSNRIEKQVHLIGMDGNPHIINLAKESFKDEKNITFVAADILDVDFNLPECDILISTHFMYHFTDQELTTFLSKHATHIKQKIIFSELHRNVFSYIGFMLIGFLFRLPKLITSDGLLAIRRSFRKKELIEILAKASVGKSFVKWKWAFRYLVIVERSL